MLNIEGLRQVSAKELTPGFKYFFANLIFQTVNLESPLIITSVDLSLPIVQYTYIDTEKVCKTNLDYYSALWVFCRYVE